MVIVTVVHNFGLSKTIDRHNEQTRQNKRRALLLDIQPAGSVTFGKQFQKTSARISRANRLIGGVGPTAVPVAHFESITSPEPSVAEFPDGSCG